MILENEVKGDLVKIMHTPFTNNVVLHIDYYQNGKIRVVVKIYACLMKPNPYPVDYLSGEILYDDAADLEYKIETILRGLNVPERKIKKVMEEQ